MRKRKYGEHNWRAGGGKWELLKDQQILEFIAPRFDLNFQITPLEIRQDTCPCGVTKVLLRTLRNRFGNRCDRVYVYNRKSTTTEPPCSLEIDRID